MRIRLIFKESCIVIRHFLVTGFSQFYVGTCSFICQAGADPEILVGEEGPGAEPPAAGGNNFFKIWAQNNSFWGHI